MADSPFSYYTLLNSLVDKGFGGIEGRFGIAYICTNRKWGNFGIQTCLIYGWGVPWLVETMATASAYLKHVEKVLAENFTGFRVVKADRCWQMVREQVELGTGRRVIHGEGVTRQSVVADETKQTFEQWLQKMKDSRMADRKRKELYQAAAYKWSEEKKAADEAVAKRQAEADRINSHKSSVKFVKKQ